MLDKNVCLSTLEYISNASHLFKFGQDLVPLIRCLDTLTVASLTQLHFRLSLSALMVVTDIARWSSFVSLFKKAALRNPDIQVYITFGGFGYTRQPRDGEDYNSVAVAALESELREQVAKVHSRAKIWCTITREPLFHLWLWRSMGGY